MSILQKVKSITRPKHDLMEKLLGSDRLENFSIEEYELLISTHYIFHSHLEEKAKEFLSDTDSQKENKKQVEKLNLKEKVKSISLEYELKQLLVAPHFQKIKEIPNTISLSNYYSLLGRIYVAEGSMLGGQMMYRILSQNQQISAATDFSFFKNYEMKTPSLWKAFIKLVEEECVSEEKQELFIEGAEKSYLYFEGAFYKSENILNPTDNTH